MGLAPVSRVVTTPDNDVIASFLRAQGWADARQTPIQEDFSGRLYRRLHGRDESDAGVILMRMRRPQELGPFMRMQKILDQCGIRVPAIYAADEENGLALLEDLGDARFDRLLEAEGAAEKLYPLAVDVLIALHAAALNPDPQQLGVPHYNAGLFLEQVSLFLDVYGENFLPQKFSSEQRAEFLRAWEPLKAACAVASCLILRDYHAANILYLAQEKAHRRAGIIDFQDGGVGPITYDLVSLLEDARRDVPQALQRDMIDYYLRGANQEKAKTFRETYPVIAAERHMRVIAVTGKRWIEKGDELAGDYCRRSWRLLYTHTSAPELAPLFQWLDKNVPENARQNSKPR